MGANDAGVTDGGISDATTNHPLISLPLLPRRSSVEATLDCMFDEAHISSNKGLVANCAGTSGIYVCQMLQEVPLETQVKFFLQR